MLDRSKQFVRTHKTQIAGSVAVAVGIVAVHRLTHTEPADILLDVPAAALDTMREGNGVLFSNDQFDFLVTLLDER